MSASTEAYFAFLEEEEEGQKDCPRGAQEKYVGLPDLLLGAAKQQ